ncbi:MAG: sterol desaturase family protein [Gemmataceae bacterium]|nr:sterol desaturase family protein [Gemmataceae bacterium]
MNHEDSTRLVIFAIIFAIFAIAELAMPRRPLVANKPKRWLSNLSLVAINTVVLRFAAPLSLSSLAESARINDWSLFNNLNLPVWLVGVLAVIALDFVVYLQHVLFHALPILWRLHRVHHADLDVDVTTGLRFHTIEIAISLCIKFAAVLVLGVPPIAVLVFEVLLNGTSIFNHANIKLPTWLDRMLRLFVVTPDMHRIHHSVHAEESNTNFGFNLPWWDYLLGTYLAAPAQPHETMALGLADLRDEETANRLPAMLSLPFRSQGGTNVDKVAHAKAQSREEKNNSVDI